MVPAVYLTLATGFFGISNGWMTNYDAKFTFSCPDNQMLKGILSDHNNYYEDRVFEFSCAPLPRNTPLTNCGWSDYANNFDDLLEFQCPNDGIVTGIDSNHDNYNEDRRYKFRCCNAIGHVAHACQYTGIQNSYDGRLNYRVPDGWVMKGVSSRHSNQQEDRQFWFDICKLEELLK